MSSFICSLGNNVNSFENSSGYPEDEIFIFSNNLFYQIVFSFPTSKKQMQLRLIFQQLAADLMFFNFKKTILTEILRSNATTGLLISTQLNLLPTQFYGLYKLEGILFSGFFGSIAGNYILRILADSDINNNLFYLKKESKCKNFEYNKKNVTYNIHILSAFIEKMFFVQAINSIIKNTAISNLLYFLFFRYVPSVASFSGINYPYFIPPTYGAILNIIGAYSYNCVDNTSINSVDINDTKSFYNFIIDNDLKNKYINYRMQYILMRDVLKTFDFYKILDESQKDQNYTTNYLYNYLNDALNSKEITNDDFTNVRDFLAKDYSAYEDFQTTFRELPDQIIRTCAVNKCFSIEGVIYGLEEKIQFDKVNKFFTSRFIAGYNESRFIANVFNPYNLLPEIYIKLLYRFIKIKEKYTTQQQKLAIFYPFNQIKMLAYDVITAPEDSTASTYQYAYFFVYYPFTYKKVREKFYQLLKDIKNELDKNRNSSLEIIKVKIILFIEYVLFNRKEWESN